MSLPTVSVVICTYNHADFVGETVESVLRQSYPHVEIIVADDGSTDATRGILESFRTQYPDHVKLVLSAQNTGIPTNINRGLALRTGALTAWLDGDDVMLPAKLETQVRFLLENPHARGCYHDADVFESDTGRSLGRMSLLYNGTPHLRQGILENWAVPRNFFLPSAMMAWSSATPTHGYDERLKHLSEVVFFIETFRTGLLLAIDEVLVRYRRHGANITGSASARAHMYEYEMLAYTILETRYPDLGQLLRPLRASAITAEALRAHRDADENRSRALITSLWRLGAWRPALTLTGGLLFAGKMVDRVSGSSTYTRPDWIKRLARTLLK